jgi:hypothetical protein
MSKRQKPDPDLAAWCEALAQSTAPVDIVPPGWFSVSELSKKLIKPVPTLQQKMQHLLKTGKATRKIFRVRLEKTVRPVPHYKLK